MTGRSSGPRIIVTLAMSDHEATWLRALCGSVTEKLAADMSHAHADNLHAIGITTHNALVDAMNNPGARHDVETGD